MFKDRAQFEEVLAKGAEDLKTQLKEKTSRVKNGTRKTEEKPVDSKEHSSLKHLRRLMNKPGLPAKMKETLKNAHAQLSKDLELRRFQRSGDSKKVDQKIAEDKEKKGKIKEQIKEHVDEKGVKTTVKDKRTGKMVPITAGGGKRLNADQRAQIKSLEGLHRKATKEGKPQESLDAIRSHIDSIKSPDSQMKPKSIGKQSVPTKRAMATGEGIMVTDRGQNQAADAQRHLKTAENAARQESQAKTTVLSKPETTKKSAREEWEEQLAKSLEYLSHDS